MELHFVLFGLGAVENDHFAAFQLVHRQLAHIGIVAEEGGSVGKANLLIDDPVLGHIVIQVIQHPHAVVFQHHPLGVVLHLQLGQIIGVQLAFVLQHLDEHIGRGKQVGVVLLHALFAQQQQGALAGVEALVFQRLLNELGLTGLQKAGKQIDRQIHLIPPQTVPSWHWCRSWSR